MTDYPNLSITNKNHLAKLTAGTVDGRTETIGQMAAIIQKCEKKCDELWNDNHRMSKIEEGKIFRSCKWTDLGKLLGRIDKKILSPHDAKMPCHIHGGIKHIYLSKRGKIIKRSAESAALSLVNGKNTWLIKMDLRRFYEQITKEDIFHLLHNKCGCSIAMANFIAEIATVNEGPKNTPLGEQKLLARGFATSSRLAIWAKINFFLELRQVLKKICKNNSCRVALYIDDIGVTIKTKDPGLVLHVAKKIKQIAKKHGLDINDKKTEIYPPEYRKEHLGCCITNNGILIDSKSQQKEGVMKKRVRTTKNSSKTKTLKRRLRGCQYRKTRIENY